MSDEHVIWIVMRTAAGSCIPLCWRHTEADGIAAARALQDTDVTKSQQYVHHWCMPVSEVPLEVRP